MLKKIIIFLLIIFPAFAFSQTVGIGTTLPNTTSSILDIVSANKGLLIPRLETSAVTTPITGLLVFQPSDKSFYYYNGTSWISLSGSLVDADGDTKIIAVDHPSRDSINFSVDGILKLVLKRNTAGDLSIQPLNSSSNLFIGEATGPAITTGTNNTSIGQYTSNLTSSGSNNSAIGGSALALNTSGSFNTAVGNNAAYSTGTGSENTAVGSLALFSNRGRIGTTAIGARAMYNASNSTLNDTSFNTAVGYSAMIGNINPAANSGTYNTALGYETMTATGSGSFNLAAGARSMYVNSSGNFNTSVGVFSMYNNASGSYNTSMGENALAQNTNASYNTAIGEGALFFNKAGSNATAVGTEAMQNSNSSTTAFTNNNTAVGYQALFGSLTPSSNTGVGNTAVGNQTMKNNSTGFANVAIGESALLNNSSANSNTAVGYQTLSSVTTGIGNTAIGRGSDVFGSGTSNAGALGTNTKVGCTSCIAIGDTINNIKIGMGTGVPTTAKLVIKVTTPGDNGLDLSSNDGYADMRVIRNTFGTADKDLYLNYGSTGGNHIYSAGVETVTVSGDKVGIDNLTPAEKLDVIGTAKATLTNTGNTTNPALLGTSNGINTSGTNIGADGIATGGFINYGVRGQAASGTNALRAYGLYGISTNTANVTGAQNVGLRASASGTGGSSAVKYGVISDVSGDGTSYGVRGDAGTTGSSYGVYGNATGTTGIFNYGLYGNASGASNSNYGIYASATGPVSSNVYAAYFQGQTRMNGNLGLYTDPTHELHIKLQALGLNNGVKYQWGTDNWVTYLDASLNYAFAFDGVYKGSISPVGGMYTASDLRLKKDLEPMQSVLPNLLKLKPTRYFYKDNKDVHALKQDGFIAQDLLPLFPEVVAKSDEYYSVNYSALVPVAIKAIQEQQQIIDAQNAKIKSQEERIQKLEKMMKTLLDNH